MATFVLIPGAGGDPVYWYRVAPLLVGAGHRVVPVDLPQHAGTTLTDQVDAVVTAVGDDPAGPLVLVALSMGALIAPSCCQRLPVALLVYLNAMIPRPGETAGEWWDAVGQNAARRRNDELSGRDPAAAFDPDQMFFHDVPPEVRTFVLMHEPRTPAESLFSDVALTAPHPSIPTRSIAGHDDRLFPAELQRTVSRARLGIEPVVVPGGHLVTLSRPVELVQELLRILSEVDVTG